MPSTRLLARGSGLVAAVAFAGIAAGQTPGVEPSLGVEIEFRFFGALVVNLLLGGALVGFAPDYARETVAEIREDPGSAFVWGLLVGIGGSLLIALLAITIIGLVVAIPGAILLAIVGLVGNAVTVVWIGSLLTGVEGRPGGKAAAVGALALALPAAIPVLGNLITTVVGFFGVGVVVGRLYRSWRD